MRSSQLGRSPPPSEETSSELSVYIDDERLWLLGKNAVWPLSGVAISSSEHDTVAPESRNNDEAADEEDRVTEDAVTNSTPQH